MAKPDWVIEVKHKLDNMVDISTQNQRWNKRSIYKIHSCITDLNQKAFTPHVVSFGPYHHGQKHLEPLEEHKERALLQILKRSKKPFDAFLESLSEVVETLRDSYDPLGQEWRENQGKFLKMMVLDGCFMLESLRTATDVVDDYATSDPILGNHGKLYIMPLIKRDMLMIENQLPMLLLERLLAVEGNKADDDEETAKKLIVKFFCPGTPLSKLGKCLHVLDVYRKSLLLDEPSDLPPGRSYSSGEDIIWSATELIEAGILLKKSKTSSLRDITFRHGVLRLPSIMVDDASPSMFLNLMAYERFHVGAGNEVSSYIFFMDCIIDTERDVALLTSKGIIRNAFGSDKAVANLFNSLSRDITTDPEGYLEMVHRRVGECCKRPWNAWRANLMHTYFRSPWAILSLMAAVFLFGLTIGQTIYTVYPFYHPN